MVRAPALAGARKANESVQSIDRNDSTSKFKSKREICKGLRKLQMLGSQHRRARQSMEGFISKYAAIIASRKES